MTATLKIFMDVSLPCSVHFVNYESFVGQFCVFCGEINK